jgi:hypothetical protein
VTIALEKGHFKDTNEDDRILRGIDFECGRRMKVFGDQMLGFFT